MCQDVRSYCRQVGHQVDSCWQLHSKLRPLVSHTHSHALPSQSSQPAPQFVSSTTAGTSHFTSRQLEPVTNIFFEWLPLLQRHLPLYQVRVLVWFLLLLVVFLGFFILAHCSTRSILLHCSLVYTTEPHGKMHAVHPSNNAPLTVL